MKKQERRENINLFKQTDRQTDRHKSFIDNVMPIISIVILVNSRQDKARKDKARQDKAR